MSTLPELHAFPDSLVFARQLGAALGRPVERIALHHFPDWESLVRVRATPGAPAIVVRSLDDPNAKLVELLLAADALRRAGAGELTLVAPYLAYMRQDRVFTPGEPVSQRVVGALLGGAFDRVLTVEAHLHRVRTLEEVFPCRAASLPAAPLLAAWLREHAEGALLVAPDEESEPWVRSVAARAGLPFCAGRKRRHGDAAVELALPALPAGVTRALLVDDIASTGATLAACGHALRKAGVTRVDALVVHAVFAAGSLPALAEAGIAHVASTDTIPHPTNQIGVAALLAAALAGGSGLMFRLRRMGIDTLSEHVIFIAESAVEAGALGFKPLDRVRVIARRADGGDGAEVSGVLNFCLDGGLAPDEIGLSEAAFRDLGLPEGAPVEATHTRAPESVERVRRKLRGESLSRADFDAILADVCARRYAKPELAMFVLACALRRLDSSELIAFTEAMIACGARLSFAAEVVADKHCIGGIPGNRTTLVLVPILAALGLTVPKTSSRAITSPSGTADTMAALAEVALSPEQIRSVVERTGACIAWGGALDLAPADDVLITVERPMGIDTEGQMIASILSKKKTAGATHALIDIPVGPTAKVRSRERGEALAERFREVARAIALRVEVVLTEARAPIGRGVGPRLEALDVLAVLKREPHAPIELREKSLYLAARLLECTGTVGDASGYRAAQRALDSGAALAKLEEIIEAQGRRALPPAAPFRGEVTATQDGRVREIDCFEVNTIAKLAGAPANPAAGLCILRGVDSVVARGEPLFEVHAQSRDQLGFALEYAQAHPHVYRFGF